MTLQQLIASLQKTFAEWREAFDKMLERLGNSEKRIADLEAGLSGAKDAIGRVAVDPLAVANKIIGTPGGLRLLTEAITKDRGLCNLLAAAISAANYRFYDIRDAIATALGPVADSCRRNITQLARQLAESKDETPVILDHIGEYIQREQAMGNLPEVIAVDPTPSANDTDDGDEPPADDPLIDAALVMESIKAVADEAHLQVIPEGDIKRLANNFARRGDATRHLSNLIERLTSLDPDILRKV